MQYSSLQPAVNALLAGGTVHVAAGTYVGGATVNQNVTIDGEHPVTTIIQGASRVFTITSGTVTLSDLAITGGTAPDLLGWEGSGGGVFVDFLATVTISNCSVFGNETVAEYAGGGGVYNLGNATILNSSIHGNEADHYTGFGGGIANQGDMTIQGTSIGENWAPMAGGGICNFGYLTIQDSDIDYNETDMFGGGLANGSMVFITRTLFHDNDSEYTGGGLANGWESPGVLASLQDVTFDDNAVESHSDSVGAQTPGGGGLVNGAGAILVGTNITFTDNYAEWVDEEISGFAVGGGLYNMLGGNTTLDGVYCACNYADKGGCAANFREPLEEDGGVPESSGNAPAGEPWELLARPGAEAGAATPIVEADSWLTMTHALIEWNEADQCGGGILNTYWVPEEYFDAPVLWDAHLTLLHSTLRENDAYLLGGGICNGSNADVVNTWLLNNEAGLGGGINNSSGGILSFLWFIMSDTPVSAPPADDVRSWQNLEGSVPVPEALQDEVGPTGVITLTNVALSCNEVWGVDEEDFPIMEVPGVGGGLMNLFGDARLTNVTFSGNMAWYYDDEDSYDWAPSTMGAWFNLDGVFAMTNGVVWGNGPLPPVGDGSFFSGPYTTTITYSDIELETGVWPGAGNINADPLFIDPECCEYEDPCEDGCVECEPSRESGDLDDCLPDLTLGPGSPAINTGLSSAVPPDQFDIDGNFNFLEQVPIDLGGDPRIQGVVDMGAFEADVVGLGILPMGPPGPVCSSYRIRYTINVTNTDPVGHYVWVTDTLPTGTYFAACNMGCTGSYGSPTVTWCVYVPAASVLQLKLEVGTYSTLAGVITNQVALYQAGAAGCSDPSPPVWVASSTVDTTVQACARPTPTPTPYPTGPGTCPRQPFADYAPHGIPDFSMQQDNWTGSGWTHAGPAAAADALWWLDSQAEFVLGAKYGLVTSYGAWGDHSPANVPPLVEDLAAQMGTASQGTSLENLQDGLGKFLAKQNVNAAFAVEVTKGPSAAWVLDQALHKEGVFLVLLGFWQQNGGTWQRVGGHWVAACCVDPGGRGIELADPWFDRAAGGFPGRTYGLPPTNPTVYNDAANVSYDHYDFGPTSVPGAQWSPVSYGGAALPDVVNNSVGMNFSAALEAYRGAFNAALPVYVAADYALFIRPLPGYPAVTQTTTTIQQGTSGSGQDTYLYRYAANVNYGTGETLKVGYKQTNAALLQFSLATIPAGAVVDKARLEVYAVGWTGADITFGPYAVLAPWAEAQATWNEASTGVSWSAAGCNGAADRRAAPADSLTTSGPSRWYSFDVTALVQEWLSGTLPNNGVLLWPAFSTNSLQFASNENGNVALHPKLVVTYH